MKEHLEPQMDPILEECYRMKAEFAAQFNSIEELYDYLKAREKDDEAQGRIYIDPPPPRCRLCLVPSKRTAGARKYAPSVETGGSSSR